MIICWNVKVLTGRVFDIIFHKNIYFWKKPMLILASIKSLTFIENIPALSIKFKDHKLMLPVSEHPYTYLIVNAYSFKVIHFDICYLIV